MRYVGKDFPLQDPTENCELSFDFSRHPDWNRWDYINGADVDITVVDGTDASSATRLSGSPTYCESVVKQLLDGPQNGVKYKLSCTVTTNKGATLALYSNVTGQS